MSNQDLKKQRKYMKKYNNLLKNKIRAKNRYEQNKENRKSNMKKYQQLPENKAKQKIRLKEYFSRPEIKKINSVRITKYIKLKKVENTSFRIKISLRDRLARALKLYTKEGKIMSSKQYGVDYKAIIEHLKPFPINISKYHVDHIRPLCSFNFVNDDGTQNLEEIKKASLPENHQLLLVHDNLSKGGKWEKQKNLFQPHIINK